MFQAVGQRVDARIDSQVIRLTTLLAAWRLSAGLDAAKDVAVARFYAAEGGQGRPRGRAPARWQGRLPRVPAAPLLHLGQAARTHPR